MTVYVLLELENWDGVENIVGVTSSKDSAEQFVELQKKLYPKRVANIRRYQEFEVVN